VSVTLSGVNPGIHLMDSFAALPDIASEQIVTSQPTELVILIDSTVLQGTRLDFLLQINCSQGIFSGAFHDYVGHCDTIFFDGMESCPGGWTHGGISDNWQCGCPVRYSMIDADTAYSGRGVWATGLGSGYHPEAN